MSDTDTRIRIVIADDHHLFRDALRGLLETCPRFEVIAEAGDGLETIRAVVDQQPDILLLDVAMPGIGGLETLAALTRLKTRTIVVTAGIESGELLRAMQLGARGVLLKDSAVQILIDGIERVMAGKFLVGAGIAEQLAEAVTMGGPGPTPTFGLTGRELEVIAAVACGDSNRAIAERLKISLQTVKHHLSNIFDKTGTASRIELALYSARHRLADLN